MSAGTGAVVVVRPDQFVAALGMPLVATDELRAFFEPVLLGAPIGSGGAAVGKFGDEATTRAPLTQGPRPLHAQLQSRSCWMIGHLA